MTRVTVLALDGSLASSVAVTLDVLDTANRLSREAVFDVTPTNAVGAAWPDADVLVVPGIGTRTEREVRERLSRRDARDAARAVSDAAAAGIEVASSCAGVFLLGAAGVLDGRRATTSWWLAPLFRRLYPAVLLEPDELVVHDPPVTTAGAAMAQVDLMLDVVARHAGDDLARRCARYLVVDERRSQAPYLVLGDVADLDGEVAKARQWATENLTEPLSVADVAAAVSLSTRTFARRVHDATGMSPVRFLRRLRVERAVELLETTRMPVEAVARAVGYADPTALRRAMRQETGQAPRDVRRRRQPRPPATSTTVPVQ